jgi:hypothetical protein
VNHSCHGLQWVPCVMIFYAKAFKQQHSVSPDLWYRPTPLSSKFGIQFIRCFLKCETA